MKMNRSAMSRMAEEIIALRTDRKQLQTDLISAAGTSAETCWMTQTLTSWPRPRSPTVQISHGISLWLNYLTICYAINCIQNRADLIIEILSPKWAKFSIQAGFEGYVIGGESDGERWLTMCLLILAKCLFLSRLCRFVIRKLIRATDPDKLRGSRIPYLPKDSLWPSVKGCSWRSCCWHQSKETRPTDTPLHFKNCTDGCTVIMF